LADTKLSALAEVSVPDFSDDVYLVDNTGPTSNKVGTDRLFGLAGLLPGGRLTLTTAVPVTTADVTAAGTIYYTPYLHDRIRVWDGTRWLYKIFAESSLALTVTSGKNYDVFLDDDIATLSLSAAWTNDTTRADALGTQDSVTVLASDHTKLWLGTIRASGTNTTEDSGGGTTTQVGGKRFVWNAYNQVLRFIAVKDTTDSWSYNTHTIRQANAAAGNKVEYVTGSAASFVSASLIAGIVVNNNNSLEAVAGIGVDSTTTLSGIRGAAFISVVASLIVSFPAFYKGYPGLGYHYLSWNEAGATATGTSAFTGDDGSDEQAGLTAQILA
jgi:hypothetical protein